MPCAELGPLMSATCLYLQVAASVGNQQIVQLLLKAGADKVVNVASKGAQMTPLMLAAAGGHADIVPDLLAAGAAVDSVDVNGWTPAHHVSGPWPRHACMCSNAALACFRKTVGRCHLENPCATWLLSRCAESHPVHPVQAAFKGFAVALRELLHQGKARPNPTSSKGETPLTLAALMKQRDACLVLLRYNAQTSFGKWTGLGLQGAAGWGVALA